MNTLALLISLNLLILPATVRPPKEKAAAVIKTNKVIGVSGFGGIYLYYPETDLSEFIVQFAVNDVVVKFVAELDKNDKPRRLLMLAKRGTRPVQEVLFEKPDAKNKAFFDHAENLVKVFVHRSKVHEILKKYRKPPAPPAPKN